MTDNVTANAGSGGATFATDDDGTAHHPYVKIEFGADNTQTKVSSTNPLPVDLTNTGANTTALKVDGSAVTQPVSIAAAVAVTDNGGSLTVDGAVAISGTVAVTDNASTLSVDDGGGTLTVDGTVAATQSGTWNVGTVTTVTTVSAVTAISNALPAGTNAIGKLAANSGVDIGDVDVTSQPARAATTDTITAKLATDAIQNGTTALTPKFAAVDVATSGDNTLVSAVVSKKIRVLSAFLVASAAVTVRFESGAGGTALTGQMQLAANGGFVLPFNPVGWFETASNTLLNLELSGATSVDGSLCYVEV